MAVEDRKVVTFHYRLTDEEGTQIESSREREPMAYLHGYRNIIPGLEAAMAGKDEGDSFQVTVEPADAYGERNPDAVQRVPSKHFPEPKKLHPGDVVTLQTRRGPMQATIIKVGRFNIDIDTNHPLAGRTLTFDVEITGLRDATEEEIEHGHVHGPGGVHH